MFLYDAVFKNLVHAIYQCKKVSIFRIYETIILQVSSQHFWLLIVYTQKSAVCFEFTVQDRWLFLNNSLDFSFPYLTIRYILI